MEQIKKPLLIFFLFSCLLMPSYAFPKRIVSCMPSITETLFALGLSEEVVGVTENCNYPAAAKQKEKVGRFVINLEKVVSLKPDLVIMLEGAQRSDIQKLKRFGLPVETVGPKTIPGIMEMIKELGLKTGKVVRAYRLVESMRDRIFWAKARYKGSQRIPVFLMVGYRPLVSAGGQSFINDIIEAAGGINIAKSSKSPYPQYSFEQLIELDPWALVILKGVIRKEDLLKDKRWEGLQAVKSDRILFIDPDIISRPGPRVADAVEEIAVFLHE